jgi:DNA-binding protein HU-beta
LPLTQAQLVTAVAERTQLSKSDAKRALAALDEVVLEELGNAQKVRIGGLVQLTVRVKPAQKPRKGRNPATGEEITVAPSQRASTYAPGRWHEQRARCRRCKRRAVGSLPEPPGCSPRGNRLAVS